MDDVAEPAETAGPTDRRSARAARDAERAALLEHQERQRYRTNRLEAFSDGVFAIAITLLVLELAVPLDAEQDMLAAIIAQWPSYLAYVVSFATIGAVWLGHTLITEYLDHADGTFLRLNLLLLLVVSFLPFPTKILAEHIASTDAERVATAFYGLTLMASSVLMAVLWRYAARSKLIRADLEDTEVQLLSRRLTPGIAGYGVLIVIGYLRPTVAVVGYLLIALFFLIPFPIRRRDPSKPPRGLRRFG